MKTYFLCLSLVIFLFCNQVDSFAQNDIVSQILWYRVDLKHPQNQAFFTRAKQSDTTQGDLISSIINGVRAGILRPFLNDSLLTRMMYEDFMIRLDTARLRHTQDYHLLVVKKRLQFSKTEDKLIQNHWFSKDLSSLLNKDAKETQKPNYEIEALTILEANGKPLATFSFAEVATNILLDNPECNYWVSKEKNQSMNMFDALNHQLFEAQLIQYEDVENKKTINIQSAKELKALQNKYISYPKLSAQITFRQTFTTQDLKKVFEAYQKAGKK
jgi:hypothetical protein